MGYKLDIENHYLELIEVKLKTLPQFLTAYCDGIAGSTAVRTRLVYLRDLENFLEFTIETSDTFTNKTLSDLIISDLELITSEDIDAFLRKIESDWNEKNIYKSYEEKDTGEQRILANSCKCNQARILSSIRSLYNYFVTIKKAISTNPTLQVIGIKLEKSDSPIYLDKREMTRLLDCISNGEGLTEKQRQYHKKTVLRDYAIVTLLLGTGIRVSELVGLSTYDYDKYNNLIHIHRKGAKNQSIVFSDTVAEALDSYLLFRKETKCNDASALFLSMQGNRISVHAVENLVSKYSKLITTKHITVHKLRSSFATNHLRTYHNLLETSQLMGHSNIETTKIYAALDDQQTIQHMKDLQIAENLSEKP